MQQQRIAATNPAGLIKDLEYEEEPRRPLCQEERTIDDLINAGDADIRDFEPSIIPSRPTNYMERNPLEDTGMHIATLAELKSYGHLAKRANY